MKIKFILSIFLIFHCCYGWNRLQDTKISLKYSDSDYYVYRFDDKDIYYLNKINNDFSKTQQCEIIEPRISYQIMKIIQDQRKFSFLGEAQIGYLDGNTFNIFRIKEEDYTIKFELLSLVDIERVIRAADPQGNILLDDNHFQFTSLKNYFYLTLGSFLKILTLSDNIFSIEKSIALEFQFDMRNFNFILHLQKYLFVLNKIQSSVIQYEILESGKLKLLETIEGCSDIIAGINNTFYIIREHDVITKSYLSSFIMHYKPKIMMTGIKPDGRLIICLADESRNYIEILQLKNEKLLSYELIQPPSQIKKLIVSNHNLYLIYNNIIKIYPFIEEDRIYINFYQDIVFWQEFEMILSGLRHDYIVFSDQNKYIYYQIKRFEGFIECKKEEKGPNEDFNFQLAYITTKCRFDDQSIVKFANGSCGYVQNFFVQHKYKIDYLTLGFILICALLFALFWIKCINRVKIITPSNNTGTIPKKDYPKIKNLQQNEVQNFIYEDEPVSEEMRVIPKVSNGKTSKRNQNIAIANSAISNIPHMPHTFDTPRFNFGEETKNDSDTAKIHIQEAAIEELVTDENRFTKRNEDSFGEERSQNLN